MGLSGQIPLTVDGRNPAPPWMVETLYINNGINHLSTGAGFLPSTVISHHGLVALASPAMPPLRGFPTMFFLVLQEAGEPEPGKKTMWEIDVEKWGNQTLKSSELLVLFNWKHWETLWDDDFIICSVSQAETGRRMSPGSVNVGYFTPVNSHCNMDPYY